MWIPPPPVTGNQVEFISNLEKKRRKQYVTSHIRGYIYAHPFDTLVRMMHNHVTVSRIETFISIRVGKSEMSPTFTVCQIANACIIIIPVTLCHVCILGLKSFPFKGRVPFRED